MGTPASPRRGSTQHRPGGQPGNDVVAFSDPGGATSTTFEGTHTRDAERWMAAIAERVAESLRLAPLEAQAPGGREGVYLQFLRRVKSVADALECEVAPAVLAAAQVHGKRLGDYSQRMLTRREWDVMQCLDQGVRPRQVARQLQISEDTVYKHISNAASKLGVRGIVEALSVFRRLRALDGGGLI